MLVRFPNDNVFIEVENFDVNEFKVEKEFESEMFGWWKDIYVSIKKVN